LGSQKIHFNNRRVFLSLFWSPIQTITYYFTTWKFVYLLLNFEKRTQNTCRGLCVLRQWITSDDAIATLRKKYGLDINEASRYLRESLAPYVSRCWNECGIFFTCQRSHWVQSTIRCHNISSDTHGNLVHIHSILQTTYDIENQMRDEGIVPSLDHFMQILTQAKSYLTHQCHLRCQIPCMSRNGETFFCQKR